MIGLLDGLPSCPDPILVSIDAGGVLIVDAPDRAMLLPEDRLLLSQRGALMTCLWGGVVVLVLGQRGQVGGRVVYRTTGRPAPEPGALDLDRIA